MNHLTTTYSFSIPTQIKLRNNFLDHYTKQNFNPNKYAKHGGSQLKKYCPIES